MSPMLLRSISPLAFPLWRVFSALSCAVFILASCASTCTAFGNDWLANPTSTIVGRNKRLMNPSALISSRHQQQRYPVLLFHKILGLTDDGDFCLGGINYFDDEPNDSSAFSSASASSSIGATVANNKSNNVLFGAQQQQQQQDLFQFLSPAQHAPEIAAEVDPVDEYLLGNQPQAERPSTRSIPAYTPIQSSVANGAIATTPKIRQSTTTSTLGSNKEEIQQVQNWLLEFIPTLCNEDLNLYAQSLTAIGFHPKCVTQSELHYDDLDFMKLLHRRYLYKKIVQRSHSMVS